MNWLQLQQQASIYLDQGDFEQAIALKPDFYLAAYQLGSAFMAQGRFIEAIAQLEKAIAAKPDYAEAFCSLGFALSRTGDYDQAIHCAKKAIALQPNCIEAYCHLANACAWQGDMSAARNAYQQYLQLMTDKPVTPCPTPHDIKNSLFYLSTSTNPTLETVPIIFIHKENPAYFPLPYSLAQAKKSNPKSHIFLIGDSTNQYDFIEHYNLLNYFQEAREFLRVYHHLSVNQFDYELLCFQRWFVLKEFMITHKLERCLYLDSDVMLYTNATAEAQTFAEFDFTLYKGVSGHCNFISSLKALEKFCNFLFEFYTNPLLFQSVALPIQTALENGELCGLSDMSAFTEYAKRGLGKIGDLSLIQNNSVYDGNIRIADGFEMNQDTKNIHWIEDKAYCKLLKSHQEIRFHALHFQGHSKRYMIDAFHQRKW